ncbi:hypothetical protein J3459_018623 [Metarhizium acridum]|nr:hypothetical protein J3459_018623 [Metarhizium acridum]
MLRDDKAAVCHVHRQRRNRPRAQRQQNISLTQAQPQPTQQTNKQRNSKTHLELASPYTRPPSHELCTIQNPTWRHVFFTAQNRPYSKKKKKKKSKLSCKNYYSHPPTVSPTCQNPVSHPEPKTNHTTRQQAPMCPQTTSPPSPERRSSTSSTCSSSSSSTIPGDPPRKPRPWTWRCTRCKMVYQISATVRCLECGNRVGKRNRRGVRNRHAEAENLFLFDYIGWIDQRAWARKMRKAAQQGTPDDGTKETEETRGGVKRTSRTFEEDSPRAGHNCFLECAYPRYCYAIGKRSRDRPRKRRRGGN